MSSPTMVDHNSKKGRDRISQITARCRTFRFGASMGGGMVPALIRSRSVMIWANANTPMRTGRN